MLIVVIGSVRIEKIKEGRLLDFEKLESIEMIKLYLLGRRRRPLPPPHPTTHKQRDTNTKTT